MAGTLTALWAGQSGVQLLAWERDFSLVKNVQTGLKATEPTIQWVPEWHQHEARSDICMKLIIQWVPEWHQHEADYSMVPEWHQHEADYSIGTGVTPAWSRLFNGYRSDTSVKPTFQRVLEWHQHEANYWMGIGGNKVTPAWSQLFSGYRRKQSDTSMKPTIQWVPEETKWHQHEADYSVPPSYGYDRENRALSGLSTLPHAAERDNFICITLEDNFKLSSKWALMNF
jgi:hypothetical protein